MNPTRTEIEQFIRWLAPQFGLDAELHLRQCHAESNFNQAAISPCGAVGLMQLMPATAAELKVDPKDWRQNVTGALKYMARLKAKYGEYPKALAAYNWGGGHLDKCIAAHGDKWREHLPAETSAYLLKILT
jgi:soluble lytic murein transglycosylase-like protein